MQIHGVGIRVWRLLVRISETQKKQEALFVCSNFVLSGVGMILRVSDWVSKFTLRRADKWLKSLRLDVVNFGQ